MKLHFFLLSRLGIQCFFPLCVRPFLFIVLGGSSLSFAVAQGVKIDENRTGVTQVSPSAILELSSTTKGLLLPRVTDTNNVAAPVRGLFVYQTKDNKIYFYNGGRWSGTGDPPTTNTNTNNQTLQQVLTAGNSANNLDIVDVDSLQTRVVKINPTQKLGEFSPTNKLLAVASDGVIRTVDPSTFFKAKVYKKNLQVTDQFAPSTRVQAHEKTIYYTYKAYGDSAAFVRLDYRIKQPTDDPVIFGKNDEVSYILIIPSGVELRYIHISSPYALYAQQSIVSFPSTTGSRLHIIYNGVSTMDFNQVTTRTNGFSPSTIHQDPQFMSDFYLPIIKTSYIPDVDALGTESNINYGMGYVDDYVLPFELAENTYTSIPAYRAAYTFKGADNSDHWLPIVYRGSLNEQYYPTTTLVQPLARFRLIYAQGNRMIIGMTHVVPPQPASAAVHLSIFF